MSIRYRFAAYIELFGRYRKIFLHYWQRRKSLDGSFFNEHEADFLPSALSIQERPVSSTARVTASVLILLVAAAVVWACLGRVDIIVNAQGKVVSSGRTKVIASVEVASVRALYVSEGQQVKAGDVLVELDSSASDAERDKAIGDQSDAILEAARAQALIAAIDGGRSPQLPALSAMRTEMQVDISAAKWQAEQLHVDGLYRDYLAKLARIDGDVARYTHALPLATERANDYQALLKNHDVALHAWLEKEQARVDLEGQLADAKNQRAALVAETRRMAYDQLTEGNRVAASSRQDALRSTSRSKLMRLVAPVDGTVQQLVIHTVGGVVPAAQPLMQIVPNEKAFEVEASLENKDIGFVREGQPAEVKVDAFEYTKFGTISARVAHVSRDAFAQEKSESDANDGKKEPLYSVKVVLDRSSIVADGNTHPLTAGMSVNVEIRTGERRIIEYVLSPLMQHEREALHER